MVEGLAGSNKSQQGGHAYCQARWKVERSQVSECGVIKTNEGETSKEGGKLRHSGTWIECQSTITAQNSGGTEEGGGRVSGCG